MATINFARREIEAKIVYCGPALSGKTTNLRILHDIVPKIQRGDLHVLDTANDRTLFFDYIPMELGDIAGFVARFKLFTVPGQRVYAETRREVLKGADAVVFVADSQPDREEANVESLADLEANLRANGMELRAVPFVIQLNKRDHAQARDPVEMARQLNHHGVPVVEAIASTRYGVLDTLYRVTEITGQRIRESIAGRQSSVAMTAVERRDREDDAVVVQDHLDRVQKVRPDEEAHAERIKVAAAGVPDDLESFMLEFVDREEGPSSASSTDPALALDARVDALVGRVGTTPRIGTPRIDTPRIDTRPPVPPRPPPPIVMEPPPIPGAPTPAAPRPAHANPPASSGARLPRGLGIEVYAKPEVWGGAVVTEFVGLDRGPDGDTLLDLVLERNGSRTRHAVRFVPGLPVVPSAPAPNLAMVVAGAMVAGTLVGVLLVKLAIL